MSSENDVKELFQRWNELTLNVGVSFGEFDFDSIKEVRKEQREIEDIIYTLLLNNAPNDIKKNLPEGCGELEIGFNENENKFYFLMYDPEQDEEEEPGRIVAITIGVDNKVGYIKDFKEERE